MWELDNVSEITDIGNFILPTPAVYVKNYNDGTADIAFMFKIKKVSAIPTALTAESKRAIMENIGPNFGLNKNLDNLIFYFDIDVQELEEGNIMEAFNTYIAVPDFNNTNRIKAVKGYAEDDNEIMADIFLKYIRSACPNIDTRELIQTFKGNTPSLKAACHLLRNTARAFNKPEFILSNTFWLNQTCGEIKSCKDANRNLPSLFTLIEPLKGSSDIYFLE